MTPWLPIPMDYSDSDGEPYFAIMQDTVRIGTVPGEENAKSICDAFNNMPGHAVDVNALVNAIASFFFHGQRKPEILTVITTSLRTTKPNEQPK